MSSSHRYEDTRTESEKKADKAFYQQLLDLEEAVEETPWLHCSQGEGLGAFEFWITDATTLSEEARLFKLLDNHGIEVQAENVGAGYCGRYYPHVETLIHGDGGVWIQKPALFRHNAWSCAEGNYQADR